MRGIGYLVNLYFPQSILKFLMILNEGFLHFSNKKKTKNIFFLRFKTTLKMANILDVNCHFVYLLFIKNPLTHQVDGKSFG